MNNNSKKYNNFNAQCLFDKFSARYRPEYKNMFKRADLKQWLKLYCKSELFLKFIFMLIATLLIHFFSRQGGFLYWLIYIGWLLTFLVVSVTDYWSDYRVQEKIIANDLLDEIFAEEKIDLNEDSLSKIIKASRHIGDKESRIFREIKISGLWANTKSLSIGFLGFILGHSQKIVTEGNVPALLRIFLALFLLVQCVSFLFYSVSKIDRRPADLYVQILKDKKLTLDLKKCPTATRTRMTEK